MQLSSINNVEVLDATKAISKLTGLDFEKVCKIGMVTWWTAIFDNMVSNSEYEIPALIKMSCI
jgi:hypothetical protein